MYPKSNTEMYPKSNTEMYPKYQNVQGSAGESLCTMCSLMMFIFGTFLSITSFVLLSVPENLFVGLFTFGIGGTSLLLATCFCCYVRKERSRQLKYITNNSSMAQQINRIEMRLDQHATNTVAQNYPVGDRVDDQVF